MTVAQERVRRIEGVVIGTLTGFDVAGTPLVRFAVLGGSESVAARSLTRVTADDLGAEVALLFEAGDPERPIIAGRVVAPEAADPKAASNAERLELTAGQEVTLRCGKASITLTSGGKVLIRGSYILSRSSGANKIKGGSVQLN
jgi:hypothetical protein